MPTTMEFNPISFDWNFVFTIINLLIFYLLIKKFLWKKVMTTMDKRKEIIDKNLKESQDSKNEAQELKQQYEDKVRDINEESVRLISQAKDDAKAEYDKIIDQATTEAKRIKDDAQKDIIAQRQNAKRAEKEEITNLAVQIAQKVVGANVSAQTDSDIYDEFLKEGSEE